MVESTLIGYKNQRWSAKTTYSWGFSIQDGNQVIRAPFRQSNRPSSFNEYIIRTLNKNK